MAAEMLLDETLVVLMSEIGRTPQVNGRAGRDHWTFCYSVMLAGAGIRGGTVYGMCKAALERFSTGLAAELYADDIAVNALSPTRVVPTPGTLFHHLTSEDDPNNEPPSVMAEAALRLCSGEPKTLTGRIAYSQELLAELAPR